MAIFWPKGQYISNGSPNIFQTISRKCPFFPPCFFPNQFYMWVANPPPPRYLRVTRGPLVQEGRWHSPSCPSLPAGGCRWRALPGWNGSSGRSRRGPLGSGGCSTVQYCYCGWRATPRTTTTSAVHRRLPRGRHDRRHSKFSRQQLKEVE